MAADSSSTDAKQDTNVVETLQSLIVAFVLAMTFRGFVTEGFVIPTGSMAPTLLGRHLLLHSQQTGARFAVGLDASDPERVTLEGLTDPMLGYRHSGVDFSVQRPVERMGDRILVLKCLYPFVEPKRYDVVVFKNPTDPLGEAANYIKRLVGLPNEQVWLADGDVFARADGAESFHVQRKPEHVQRAVWQPVFHSDLIPVNPQRLNEQSAQRYEGSPWVGRNWDTGGRDYRTSSTQPTLLMWDESRRPINDFTPYTMLAMQGRLPQLFPISDLRVSAAITPDQAGFSTTFVLKSREHEFEWTLEPAMARMRMKAVRSQEWELVQESANFVMPSPGRTFNVEFWHADQAMRLYIDGVEIAPPLEYDWSPMQRLQNATGDLHSDDVDSLVARPAQPPQLLWRFSGSPVTLRRVQLDRDLFYRSESLRTQRNQPTIDGPGFGTHPTENPGILGPDQFMMCGDNSQMSLDSRLWGSPDPLIASQIDDAPFVVNRKLLLGKAWVVYFPAPLAATERGPGIIPDLGRLRFIR